MIIIYIFVILSITGMILNAKKNRWGYILWIISDILYMLEQPIIGLVLIVTAAYGFITWTNDIKKNNNISL